MLKHAVQRSLETDFITYILAKGGPEPSEYAYVDAWLRELERELRDGRVSQAQHQSLLAMFGDALSEKTMQGRSFRRPRGYHGDFEMIDRIYREAVTDDPSLARWDCYFHAHAAPRAVRNRKTYFHEVVSQHRAAATGTLRVLNLASGPARDVREWLDVHGAEDVSFECVDADPDAIAYASQLCQAHAGAVSFHLANALRFKPRARHQLVWSAGLFDYLSDSTFARLLKRMLSFAEPGGEVVVGNFGPNNPSRAYMELVGGWNLHHRSEEELRALAVQAGADERHVRVGAEPEGVNLFLHVDIPR